MLALLEDDYDKVFLQKQLINRGLQKIWQKVGHLATE